MFASPSSPVSLHDPKNPQDRNYRPTQTLTNTQSSMGFTAGSTSSSAYASWGSASAGGGVNEPFTPSRSHYQPGYLMSVTQSNVVPPGGQHFEDPPLIPIKFNSSTSRTSPSEFGLESAFERPTARRQRQPTNDDAPPTMSVNDMVDDVHTSPFQRKDGHPGSPLNLSTARRQPNTPQQPQTSSHQPIIYLNVFGYPPDHYESVTRLFRSLGDTTEPELSENGMWFTIGFRQVWEAERALRKNGKLMDEMYMIGVARAHSSAADTPLDGPRPGGPAITPGSPPNPDPISPGKDSLVPAFGTPRSATSSFGVPLTLAPATAAFKPHSTPPKAQPQQQPQPGNLPETSALSKISDLIFGW